MERMNDAESVQFQFWIREEGDEKFAQWVNKIYNLGIRIMCRWDCRGSKDCTEKEYAGGRGGLADYG